MENSEFMIPKNTAHKKSSMELNSSLAKWTVSSAYSKEDIAIRNLFEMVFSHPMPQEHWDWKYAQTKLKGILLKNSVNESVAFFGGMPRTFCYAEQEFHCVQNGDVMVLPSERGVFSKKGALYQVASNFFNAHVGSNRDYVFAFGFPNLRHFKLGVKLGLYEQAGMMKELRWPIATKKKHFFWRWSVANNVQMLQMADLWRKMRKDFSQKFVGVRDEARWIYRYDQHPSVKYLLLRLQSNLTQKTIAAVVVREHIQYCELIDFVGEIKYIPQTIQAVREFSAERGKSTHLLISDAAYEYFISKDCETFESNIKIPVNISIHDTKVKPWLGKIWLMAGDSDFM